MLRALIAGEASPEAMADLARGQLRRKRADLILALDGRLDEHHRFLLAVQLRRLEATEADIAGLDQRIGERLEPYSAPHALLMHIPGVDWVVAAALIAEIGVDMSVFLSVHHLSAWAGVCPCSYESAGRRESGRARPKSTRASRENNRGIIAAYITGSFFARNREFAPRSHGAGSAGAQARARRARVDGPPRDGLRPRLRANCFSIP
jgi:transposase